MASFPLDTANYPVDDEPISYHDDHSEVEWEGAIREANDATIAMPILGRPYSETVDMSSSSRDPSVGDRNRNNDDDGQFSIDSSLEDALNMSVSSVDMADLNSSADDVFAQRLESLKAKEADVTPAAYFRKSIKCIKTHYSFSESSHRSKEEGDRIAEAEASRFAGGAVIEAPVEFIDTALTSSDDDDNDDDKSGALRAELERQMENDQPIVVVDTDMLPTDRAKSLYSDSESENGGSTGQPKAKSQKTDSSHKRLNKQFFAYGSTAEPTAAQLEEPNVDNDSDDSFEDTVAATQQKRQKMVVNADRIMKKASIHCEEDDSATEEEAKASPVRSKAGTRNQRRRAPPKAAPGQKDAPMQSDDDNDDDSFEDRVKATKLRRVPSISPTKKKKSKSSSRQPKSQQQQQQDKVEKVKPFTGRLVEEPQDAKEDEDSDASSGNVDNASDDSFEERVRSHQQRRARRVGASPPKSKHRVGKSRRSRRSNANQPDEAAELFTEAVAAEDLDENSSSSGSDADMSESSADSSEDQVRAMNGRSVAAVASPRNNKSVKKKKEEAQSHSEEQPPRCCTVHRYRYPCR